MSLRGLLAAAVVLGAGLAALPAGAATPSGPTVFRQAGCGSCHTLAAAGASGNVGVDLDQLKPSAATVAAQVRSGGGGMPSFAGTLSSSQIQAVASWVASVSGKTSTPAAPAATTVAGLQQKHTNADMAAAGRVSLTLGDVALGWTSSPAPTTEQSPVCAAWHPDLAGVVETGAASSDSLQGGKEGPFVSESAWLYKTAAQAQTLWSRVVGKKLIGCLASSVTKGSTADVKFTVRSQDVRELGKTRAAYRVVATAATSGQSVTTYYDLVVVRGGRGVAEITVARVGAPPAPSAETAFAKAVAQRLGAISR
jgi:mono/diheme cytochrome c family protein